MAKVKLENQAQKERMFQLYDTFYNLNVVPFIKSDMDLRWFKLVNSIVSSTISPFPLPGKFTILKERFRCSKVLFFKKYN